MELSDHLPVLLARARALLGLRGGPATELAKGEIAAAARAVTALHEGLVGERRLAQASTYDDPKHLGAYLLWWWPQTYTKVRAALRLTALQLPAKPRILDLGAGPGPAAVAALDALGGEALAVDASAAALAEARALGVSTQQQDLSKEAPPHGFDLTIAANVLSELSPERRAAMVAREGITLILEPALRETGRALLQLRDNLLAAGTLQALAPCLTQKPCPAFAHPREWCTAEVRWNAPRHIRQLADATGLRADELLSYAPLILAPEAPAPRPGEWRVVGDPPPEKGKKRFWICSDDGRLPLVRLDRHQSPENTDFDDLGRGDRVQLQDLEKRGDGLRIGPASAITKLR